jgi:hypothetical protein
MIATKHLNPIGDGVSKDDGGEPIQSLFTIHAKAKTCGRCHQRDLRFNFCKLFKEQLFIERRRALRCGYCKKAERLLMRLRNERGASVAQAPEPLER